MYYIPVVNILGDLLLRTAIINYWSLAKSWQWPIIVDESFPKKNQQRLEMTDIFIWAMLFPIYQWTVYDLSNENILIEHVSTCFCQPR